MACRGRRPWPRGSGRGPRSPAAISRAAARRRSSTLSAGGRPPAPIGPGHRRRNGPRFGSDARRDSGGSRPRCSPAAGRARARGFPATCSSSRPRSGAFRRASTSRRTAARRWRPPTGLARPHGAGRRGRPLRRGSRTGCRDTSSTSPSTRCAIRAAPDPTATATTARRAMSAARARSRAGRACRACPGRCRARWRSPASPRGRRATPRRTGDRSRR